MCVTFESIISSHPVDSVGFFDGLGLRLNCISFERGVWGEKTA